MSTTNNHETSTNGEKPRNGLAGLKEWPHDLRSGFMVAMVSLPFSMGIAITSGAPPICGVISAIVAGFVVPFSGGSYVTISGPAAGLAPALFSGMIALATADLGRAVAAKTPTSELLAIGYPLILVAIAIVGLLQVILARLRVARLSAIFPAAAIEGMLAAIGLMIMVKQIPLLFGVSFEAHEFWEILREVPHHVGEINSSVLATGLGSVAALFVLNAIPSRVLKAMPPPVWVFIGGTVIAQLALGIAPEFCINIPENPLRNGFQLPHFSHVLTTPALWAPLGYTIFLLVLIDATESLATIKAVDKLDGYKRRSDPDQTLQSMGLCNTASSFAGGLTIIPGIVKSTVNVIGGGRTLWANFFNACTLLVFLLLARPLINQVPLAILGAILIFVGWKLCGPKVWRRMADVGLEQFGIFLLTIVVTVSTDLLMGIAVGVFAKLLMDLSLISLANRLNGGTPRGGFWGRFAQLFRNPVGKTAQGNGVHTIWFDRPLHCFNLLHVIREMELVEDDTRVLRLNFSPMANVIDHTSVETVLHYVDDYRLKGIETELEGWEQFIPLSGHDHAVRFALADRHSGLESQGAL